MKMTTHFSKHARQRMAERNIGEVEILSALKSPDKKYDKGLTKVAIKRRRNKHVLIIIYKENLNRKDIIIVIDTSKITKYL